MFQDKTAVFITALGTPLNEQGDLVESSFRRHIHHQLENEMDGLLVLGSMGQMPCVKQSTLVDVARVAADTAGGRTKILVGVGDNSLERTLERIESLKDLDIDAVVATTPYYFVSAQSDLIGYFTRIADRSPVPLYLYDLPQVTKVKIELDTALQLSEHPNIHGAKCSHDAAYTKSLARLTADLGFEVIHGQLDLLDVFLRCGLTSSVDGFYAMVPGWTRDFKRAYDSHDFTAIDKLQQKTCNLRNEFVKLDVFPAFTVAMNLLGFEGRFHPSHIAPLSESDHSQVEQLLKNAGLL